MRLVSALRIAQPGGLFVYVLSITPGLGESASHSRGDLPPTVRSWVYPTMILNRLEAWGFRYGVSSDEIISQLGGSPRAALCLADGPVRRGGACGARHARRYSSRAARPARSARRRSTA